MAPFKTYSKLNETNRKKFSILSIIKPTNKKKNGRMKIIIPDLPAPSTASNLNDHSLEITTEDPFDKLLKTSNYNSINFKSTSNSHRKSSYYIESHRSFRMKKRSNSFTIYKHSPIVKKRAKTTQKNDISTFNKEKSSETSIGSSLEIEVVRRAKPLISDSLELTNLNINFQKSVNDSTVLGGYFKNTPIICSTPIESQNQKIIDHTISPIAKTRCADKFFPLKDVSNTYEPHAIAVAPKPDLRESNNKENCKLNMPVSVETPNGKASPRVSYITTRKRKIYLTPLDSLVKYKSCKSINNFKGNTLEQNQEENNIDSICQNSFHLNPDPTQSKSNNEIKFIYNLISSPHLLHSESTDVIENSVSNDFKCTRKGKLFQSPSLINKTDLEIETQVTSVKVLRNRTVYSNNLMNISNKSDSYLGQNSELKLNRYDNESKSLMFSNETYSDISSKTDMNVTNKIQHIEISSTYGESTNNNESKSSLIFPNESNSDILSKTDVNVTNKVQDTEISLICGKNINLEGSHDTSNQYIQNGRFEQGSLSIELINATSITTINLCESTCNTCSNNLPTDSNDSYVIKIETVGSESSNLEQVSEESSVVTENEKIEESTEISNKDDNIEESNDILFSNIEKSLQYSSLINTRQNNNNMVQMCSKSADGNVKNDSRHFSATEEFIVDFDSSEELSVNSKTSAIPSLGVNTTEEMIKSLIKDNSDLEDLNDTDSDVDSNFKGFNLNNVAQQLSSNKFIKSIATLEKCENSKQTNSNLTQKLKATENVLKSIRNISNVEDEEAEEGLLTNDFTGIHSDDESQHLPSTKLSDFDVELNETSEYSSLEKCENSNLINYDIKQKFQPVIKIRRRKTIEDILKSIRNISNEEDDEEKEDLLTNDFSSLYSDHNESQHLPLTKLSDFEVETQKMQPINKIGRQKAMECKLKSIRNCSNVVDEEKEGNLLINDLNGLHSEDESRSLSPTKLLQFVVELNKNSDFSALDKCENLNLFNYDLTQKLQPLIKIKRQKTMENMLKSIRNISNVEDEKEKDDLLINDFSCLHSDDDESQHLPLIKLSDFEVETQKMEPIIKIGRQKIIEDKLKSTRNSSNVVDEEKEGNLLINDHNGLHSEDESQRLSPTKLSQFVVELNKNSDFLTLKKCENLNLFNYDLTQKLQPIIKIKKQKTMENMLKSIRNISNVEDEEEEESLLKNGFSSLHSDDESQHLSSTKLSEFLVEPDKNSEYSVLMNSCITPKSIIGSNRNSNLQNMLIKNSSNSAEGECLLTNSFNELHLNDANEQSSSTEFSVAVSEVNENSDHATQAHAPTKLEPTVEFNKEVDLSAESNKKNTDFDFACIQQAVPEPTPLNSVAIAKVNEDSDEHSTESIRDTVFSLPHTPTLLKLKPGKSYRRSLLQKQNSMLHFSPRVTTFKSPAFTLQERSTNTANTGSICTRAKYKSQSLEHSTPRRLSIRFIPISPPVSEKASTLQNYATGLCKGYNSNAFQENLENYFENLSLTSDNLEVTLEEPYRKPPVTAREIVLRRCGQTEPLQFEKCYPNPLLQHCHKIGEGVYGEVFLFRNQNGGTTVMKIIPIEGDQIINGEKQKKFDEIISELIIAMELSNLRNGKKNNTTGFNELHRICCVQGKYPKRLLELWELYEEGHGTENDSPQIFTEEQLYVVLELANGGKDLEAFVFNNAQQAYAIFVQTACAIAVAEEALQFEHRDLHWGNMLISNCDRSKKNVRCCIDGKEIKLPTYGVEVGIIDFTLSRITHDGVCIYNDLSLDTDLFTAEGDYQFDIYRLMKNSNGNQWQHFQPYTNVLWLHYVLDKMIKALRYTNKKTRIHKEYIMKLEFLKQEILEYKSVKDIVNSKFAVAFAL